MYIAHYFQPLTTTTKFLYISYAFNLLNLFLMFGTFVNNVFSQFYFHIIS